jgi:hypothetical protein
MEAIMGKYYKPIDMTSLNEVLRSTPEFPATCGELASTARLKRADRTVINFFESMPGRTVVKSKDEIFKQSFETEVEMDDLLMMDDNNA